jgi:hypothetical protein
LKDSRANYFEKQLLEEMKIPVDKVEEMGNQFSVLRLWNGFI